MFLSLEDYIDFLPIGFEYIVCGQAAAKLLGLTSVVPLLSIYSTEELFQKTKIMNYKKPDLKNIRTTKILNRITCTTTEQTIVDMLQGELALDPQVLPESLAMLISDSENGTYDITRLEEYARETGVWNQYLEAKRDSEDFWSE